MALLKDLIGQYFGDQTAKQNANFDPTQPVTDDNQPYVTPSFATKLFHPDVASQDNQANFQAGYAPTQAQIAQTTARNLYNQRSALAPDGTYSNTTPDQRFGMYMDGLNPEQAQKPLAAAVNNAKGGIQTLADTDWNTSQYGLQGSQNALTNQGIGQNILAQQLRNQEKQVTQLDPQRLDNAIFGEGTVGMTLQPQRDTAVNQSTIDASKSGVARGLLNTTNDTTRNIAQADNYRSALNQSLAQRAYNTSSLLGDTQDADARNNFMSAMYPAAPTSLLARQNNLDANGNIVSNLVRTPGAVTPQATSQAMSGKPTLLLNKKTGQLEQVPLSISTTPTSDTTATTNNVPKYKVRKLTAELLPNNPILDTFTPEFPHFKAAASYIGNAIANKSNDVYRKIYGIDFNQ